MRGEVVRAACPCEDQPILALLENLESPYQEEGVKTWYATLADQVLKTAQILCPRIRKPVLHVQQAAVLWRPYHCPLNTRHLQNDQL
jgi:hypothetical protein